MAKETLKNPNDKHQGEKPNLEYWPARHAYSIAALISWLTFLTLLMSLSYLRTRIFTGIISDPSIRDALGEAAGICAIVGMCGIVSVIVGNGITSLLLPFKLKDAVSYTTLIEWIGDNNERKILNLIRLHELHVYAASPKLKSVSEYLPCRMVPLYVLPIHDKLVRWALSLFQAIYFDLNELEELFDENLDVLRRARPDKLKDETTQSREATELKILLLKNEKYKGLKGRLQSTYLINDYCRLHAFTLTLLTQNFLEKWPYWKNKDEKLITHPRIEKLSAEIIAKHPVIEKKLQELNVKGNPRLPAAMEDLFRYAMPDEMVDWRGGKPTLEHVLNKHINDNRDQQEEDTPDNNQSVL